MPEQRVKGQETILTIIKDGELQARIDSISDTETTFMLESLEEDYLGETASRYDSIFKGMRIRISGHMTNKQVIDFADTVVARAQRRAGGANRIDMATTFIFPGGDLITVNLPDLHFAEVPLNTGSRSDYVQFTLEGMTSEYELL